MNLKCIYVTPTPEADTWSWHVWARIIFLVSSLFSFSLISSLYICLSVCLAVYVCVWLSLYFSICLCVCMFVYLSICLSIPSHLPTRSLPLSFFLCLCLSVSVFLCLPLSLSHFLSLFTPPFFRSSICGAYTDKHPVSQGPNLTGKQMHCFFSPSCRGL